MVVPGGDAIGQALNDIAATTPSASFVVVEPSDDADLERPARALYIGVGGDVALVGRNDADDAGTIFTVTDGRILPLTVRRVLASGTTASNIVALY